MANELFRVLLRNCRHLSAQLTGVLALAGVGATAADPVVLRNQHVDLRIIDRPGESNRLGLVIRDGDTGTNYSPSDVILELPTSTRIAIPEGFEVFGPSNSPLWILPQSQDPDLLYLGVSAAGITAGLFDPRFQVDLVRKDGPGDFFLWQFDTFANLVMSMNSRDGITVADSVHPLTGGHEHFNWGFNASGLHEVVLRVSNRFAGTTNVATSGDITVRFGAEPYSLPTAAIAAAFSQSEWSADHLKCRVTGTPLLTYPIETSTNLTNWVRAANITMDASGIANLDLPSSTPALFVRAITP